jgi:hypothetical protein
MKTGKLFLATVFAGAAVLSLSSCAERPQDAPMQSGKYRGKPDTQPWQGGAQQFAGESFKQGDKASWDAAIAKRMQAQNEYVRIQ